MTAKFSVLQVILSQLHAGLHCGASQRPARTFSRLFKRRNVPVVEVSIRRLWGINKGPAVACPILQDVRGRDDVVTNDGSDVGCRYS